VGPEGYRIAYSADGRLIFASSLGGSVRVWNAPPGGSSRSRRTGAGHTASPSARMAVASRRAAATAPSGYGTSPPRKRSASCAGTRTTCMPSPSARTVRGWPRRRGTWRCGSGTRSRHRCGRRRRLTPRPHAEATRAAGGAQSRAMGRRARPVAPPQSAQEPRGPLLSATIERIVNARAVRASPYLALSSGYSQ
jgi:hypothetical protein